MGDENNGEMIGSKKWSCAKEKNQEAKEVMRANGKSFSLHTALNLMHTTQKVWFINGCRSSKIHNFANFLELETLSKFYSIS